MHVSLVRQGKGISMPAVAGLFGNEQAAEQALDELYELGFTDDDIEVVFGADRTVDVERPTDDNGMTVGPVGPLPIYGKERAIGLIDTYNTGGVEGLRDGLRDLGIPHDEAEFYARTIDRGGSTLIVVQADEDEIDEVRQVLN